MSSVGIRAKRLRSPNALLAALALTAVGAASGPGCASSAHAGEPAAFHEAKRGKKSTHRNARPSLAPMLKQVRPAVVSIHAYGAAAPDRSQPLPWMAPRSQGPRAGMGSGFIISKQGLIVTNHHVVDGFAKFEVVTADGQHLDATPVGSDPLTDVALLRVESADQVRLTPATLGHSKELEIGDWLVAIGSPMGLEHSVSVGILSGTGRGDLGLYRDSYLDFLQTDAAITRGNSGGPLLDLDGNVVGINTAASAISGPGFAIPIDQAKRVISELAQHGKVARGWLGAGGRSVELAGGEGARIESVDPAGPAAAGGLRAGDRVLEFNGEAVRDFDDLRRHVALTAPATKVRLKVRGEDDKARTLEIKLGERPAPGTAPRLRAPGENEPPRLGLGLQPTAKGLRVAIVEPGSLAEALGVQSGDVLTHLGSRRLRSPQQIRDWMARDPNHIKLRVRRGDRSLTLELNRE